MRETAKTVITSYGHDSAIASTLFYRNAWGGGRVGRQSQTGSDSPKGGGSSPPM